MYIDLLPVAKRLKTEGDGEPGISAEKLLIGIVCMHAKLESETHSTF